MFSLRIVSPTYQTIEMTPMRIVAMCGVLKRGCTSPSFFGSAPQRLIDRTVRAVGRIVVWVDADAEVSTASITILSSGVPNTSLANALSTSSELFARKAEPWNAWAAVLTST